MPHRVYISASTQNLNVGVLNYGTEQDQMQHLADRVAYWLKTQNKFTVFRNKSGMTLTQTVDDCNNLACELFIDNHSNAGPVEDVAGDGGAEGTEVYYNGKLGLDSKSYKIASILYKQIAPLSLGKDRGVLPDTSLYASGLYVVQHTTPPAMLIEHIFHTNKAEVTDYLKRVDDFAKAEAKGICEYFGEIWINAGNPPQTIEDLVNAMTIDGLVGDKAYWLGVLKGEIIAKPEYLQIAFKRAVDKIV